MLAETILQLSRTKPAVNNDDVQDNLKDILEKIKEMPPPQNIGFIMPDLWPTQFLMEGDKVAALIDIESYVSGPIELELAVLELWLEDFDSFRKGYESSGPKLPDLSATRDIYRYLLFIMHGCPTLGLKNLISSRHKI